MISVLIVDDHSLLRTGLRALVNTEPDLEVVGEAGDGPTALQLAAALHPDVVLMDINLPQMDGLEVTRQLLAAQPDTRVLVFTMHEDKALLQEALRAGAAGYVVKRAVESELINAIYATVRGDLYIHPTMTRALLTAVQAPEPPANGTSAGGGPADAALHEALTPREAEVLRLIALGHTNREIAQELLISPRTVESHRANLISKLGLHSRVELVRYAAAHGLLKG